MSATTALSRPLSWRPRKPDFGSGVFSITGPYGKLIRLGMFLAMAFISYQGLKTASQGTTQATIKAISVSAVPLFAIIAWSIPRAALIGTLALTALVNALATFPINPGFVGLLVLYAGVIIGAVKAPFRPLALSSLLPFWYVVWQTLLFVFVSLPEGTTFGISDMAAHFVVLLAIPLAATLAPRTDALLKGVSIVCAIVAWFVFHPERFEFGRPVALAQNSNSLGVLCAQGTAAAITLAMRRSWVWSFVAAWTTWGALHTGSRSALIGTAAAVILPLVFQRKFEWLAVLFVVAAAFVMIFPSDFSLQALLNGRTQKAQDASTKEREVIYRQALDYTIQSPLIGIGPGRFAEEIQQSQNLPGGVYVTHNDYLGTVAEGGIPSLVVILAIFILPLLIARRDPTIKSDFQALSPQVMIVAIGLLTGNLLHNPAASLSASLALGCLWASKTNRSVARADDSQIE